MGRLHTFARNVSLRRVAVIAAVLVLCTTVSRAGPEGAQVIHGSAQFNQAGNYTAIQASDKAIINYSRFDIARPETVQFIQPNADASVLNRIVSANPTTIDGTLLANGRVFFVNPAGVIFGESAQVNATQLIASAFDISNADFLQGNYLFSGGQGRVVNQGNIHAEKAYLIGKQVANSGTIDCPGGYVVLASGDRVLLRELGTDLLVDVSASMSSPAPAAPAEGTAVTNAGTVQAGGGKIILAAAGDIYSQAISNVGKLSASAEAGKAGSVELRGGTGTVLNSGPVEAASSGGAGGTVQVLGDRVGLVDNGRIDVSGAEGGGTVLVGGDYQGKGEILTAARTYVGPDATIKADAAENGDGGKVIVWSDEITGFHGNISARGGASSGNGGFVEVSGKQNLDFSGIVNTLAPQGESGTLLLDPADIEVVLGGTEPYSNVSTFGATPTAEPAKIDPATLDDVGGTVDLQATNGIAVTDAITLTTPGAGLTARAGGHIALNNSITTNGGAISLTANDAGGAPTGNGSITGGGALTTKGSDLTNAAGGAVTLSVAAGTGSINVGAIDARGGGTSANTAGGAGGTVSISTMDGDITAGTINTSGGNAGNTTAGGGAAYAGGNAGGATIQVTAATSARAISVGAITAAGGTGSTAVSHHGPGGAGGTGGAINITANAGDFGASLLTSTITTSGGAGGAGDNDVGGAGGAGGSITIQADQGINQGDAITTLGGAGGSGTSAGTDGADGSVTLISDNNITVGNSIDAGSGTIGFSFGQGGLGGTLDLSAAGTLTGSAIAATGGLGTDSLIVVRDADITLADASLTIGAEPAWTLSSIDAVTLTGGAAANTINVSGWTGARTASIFVTAGADTVTGTPTAANTTLTGTNTGSSYTIDAPNGGTVVEGANTTTFTSVGHLVGGTAADTFTLLSGVTTFSGSIDGAAGTDELKATDGTNAWALTGANAGTLNMSTTFSNMETVTGGSGTDTVTGTPGEDAFTISGANAGEVAGTTFTGVEALEGSAGDDTFTVAEGVTTFSGSIAGGGDTDSLIVTNGSNAWAVTGANSGTLNTDTLFTTIETLMGGSGTDSLTVTRDADITLANASLTVGAEPAWTLSSIDAAILTGGAATNTIDVSGWTGARTASIFVTAGADTVTGTPTAANTTLRGTNTGSTYTIDAPNGGTIVEGANTTTFTSVGHLVGGTAADMFTLASGVTTFSGSIAGGGGTDTVAATDGTNAWAISGVNAGTLNTSTVFSGITNLIGGTGPDTLTGRNAVNAWSLTGTNAAAVDGLTMTSVEALVGGNAADTFTVNSGVVFNGSIAGGGTATTDTLAAIDGTNAWAVSGVNAGTLNTNTVFSGITNLTGGTGADTIAGTAGADAFTISGANAGGVAGMAFTGVEALDGGLGNDSFTLGAGVSTFNGSITGGGDTDSLLVTNGSNAWAVTGANAGTLNTDTLFTTIETLMGGSGADTLTGTAGVDDFTISGANAGGVAGMTFAGVEALEGGLGNDNFTLDPGIATFSGSIAGGDGTDALIVTDGTNAWVVTGANAGTLNTDTLFTTIETLTGGSGADTLTGTAGADAFTVSGANAGGVAGMTFAGVEALDGGLGNDNFTLDAGIATFSGSIAGGGGTDALIMTDGTNAWTVTGANAGTLNTDTLFTTIETLTGGSGADTVTGTPGADDFTISGANAGGVAGMTFAGVEALDGGLGNDSFTLDAGVSTFSGSIAGGGGTDALIGTNGTNAWVLSGVNAGTLNAGTVFSAITNLTGGTGIDTLTGRNAPNTWSITGTNAASVDGMTMTSVEALVGGNAADIFTVNSGVVFNGSIAGGGTATTDTLAVTDGANAWAVSGVNAGTLNTSTVFSAITNLTGGTGTDTLTGRNAPNAWAITGTNAASVDGMAMTSVEALVGGNVADVFMVNSGVVFNGSIAGGGTATTDTLAVTDGANAWVVSGVNAGTLNTSTVFSAITNLTGGTGTDTLTAGNVPNIWTLTSANGGTVTDVGGGFGNMEHLVGGTNTDTFNINAGVTWGGTIDGTAGIDTLDLGLLAGAQTATLTATGGIDGFNGTVGAVTGGFSNIDALAGTGGSDTLIGLDTPGTWNITGANAGTYTSTKALTFSSFENLTGGTGADTLTAGNVPNTWTLTSANAGTVTGVGGGFSNMENLVGGTNTDTFNVNAGVTWGGTIDGAAGIDTLDLGLLAGAQTVTLTAIGGIDGFNGAVGAVAGGFSNIDGLAGTGGSDTLIGLDASGTWNITGANAGTYTSTNSLAFGSFENLTGGTSTDVFALSGGGTLSGAINGGVGTDTLTADDVPNTWTVTGANSGTVTGVGGGFSSIENLTGGSGADVFTLSSGTLSGAIDGGAGTDALTAGNGANTWTVTGANSGTVTGIGGGFSGIENLTGGSGVDAFTLSDGTLSGAIDGGAGADTLTAGNVPNIWTLTSANGGTVTGVGSGFGNMENLVGGTNTDTFHLNAGVTWGGTIDGVAGIDTLDLGLLAGAQTATLTATGGIDGFNGTVGAVTGGFSNIDALAGTGGSDTLIGLDAPGTWNITGANAGTYTSTNALTFSSFENLTGGTGADTFRFSDAGSLAGAIDGGGGGNTLTIDTAAAVEIGSVDRMDDLTVVQSGGTTFHGGVNAATVTLMDTDTAVTFDGDVAATSFNAAAQGYSVVFHEDVTITNGVTLANTGGVILGNGDDDVLLFHGGLDTTAGATTGRGSIRTSGGQMDVGALTVPGGILTLDTTNNGGSAAGSTLNVSGPVSLNGELTVTAGSGRIQVDGTVNGNHAVVFNTTGVTDLNGRIGGTTPVAGLTTDAGGTTLLGASVHAQGGTITFNDAVSLDTGPVAITDTGGTGVAFRSTVDGAQDLTLVVSGPTTFAGPVGGAAALGDEQGPALTIDSPGSTEFQSTVTTASGISQSDTAGAITFHENVTAGAGDTAGSFNGNVVLDEMTFTSAGPVTFGAADSDRLTLSGSAVKLDTTGALVVNAAVAGAQDLELAGPGRKEFNQAVGSTTPGETLRSITQNDGSGEVVFRDGVYLGSGGGTFNGNVVLNAMTLTSAGPLMLGDASGDLLTVLGATTTISTTANNSPVRIHAATTLNADLTVDVGSGRIQVDGTVDGGHALTLNTTGTTDLNGEIGRTIPVVRLETNAGGTTEILTNVRSSGNTQTYNDAVVLNGDVTFTEENASGAILFNGTVRSDGTARAMVLAGAGRKEFNQAVGSTTPGQELRSITQNDGSGVATFREDVYLGGGGGTFNGNVVLDGLTLTSAGPLTFGNTAADYVMLSGHPVRIDTAAAAQPVTFNSWVGGGQPLTVDSRSGSTGGGAVAFRTTVGGETPLTGLTVDAGSARFDGTVRVGNQGLTVTASDTVDFADTVDTGGRVGLVAGGTITTNGVRSTADNIEMRSASGDLIVNDRVTATTGGISLISDKGAINIKNPSDGTLEITGYSDDNRDPQAQRFGVDLDPDDDTDPGKAAILISSAKSLDLGQNVHLSASGSYYHYSKETPVDDRKPLNLRSGETRLEAGDPLDVAIYLKAGGEVKVVESGPAEKPKVVDDEADVTISSAEISIDPAAQGWQIATLVVDAADTVKFEKFEEGKSPELFEHSLATGVSNFNRIEVVSRMSPADLSTIEAWGTLPHASDLYEVKQWVNFASVDYEKYFSETSGDYGIYLLRAGDPSTLSPPFGVVPFTQAPPIPVVVMVDVAERASPQDERDDPIMEAERIVGNFEIQTQHPDCMEEDQKDTAKCQTIGDLVSTDWSPEEMKRSVARRIRELDQRLKLAPEPQDKRDVPLLAKLSGVAQEWPRPDAANLAGIQASVGIDLALSRWMKDSVEFVRILRSTLGRSTDDAIGRFVGNYLEGIADEQVLGFMQSYLQQARLYRPMRTEPTGLPSDLPVSGQGTAIRNPTSQAEVPSKS